MNDLIDLYYLDVFLDANKLTLEVKYDRLNNGTRSGYVIKNCGNINLHVDNLWIERMAS